jgi:hypothetical protein
MAEADPTASAGGTGGDQPEYVAEHVGIGRRLWWITKDGLLVVSGGELLLLKNPDQIIDGAPASEVTNKSKRFSFRTAVWLKLGEETYVVDAAAQGRPPGSGRPREIIKEFETALEAARRR